MSRRQTLLVGLLLASGAAVVTWRLTVPKAPSEAQAREYQLRDVLVTTRRIEKYAPLETEALALRQVNRAGVPEEAIDSWEAVQGSFAARPLSEGTILQRKDLLTGKDLRMGQSPEILKKIPPGRRALSIEVDCESSIGGTLQPGQWVDVVGTFPKDPAFPHQGPVTKTLSQRVPVLAIYHPSPAGESHAEEGKKPHPLVVTLAVTPAEANRLTLAGEIGTLRLVLHPPSKNGNNGSVSIEAATFSQLLESAGPLPSGGGAKPAAKPPVPTPAASGKAKPTAKPRTKSRSKAKTPLPRTSYRRKAKTSSSYKSSQRRRKVSPKTPRKWPVKVIRGTEVETVFVDR